MRLRVAILATDSELDAYSMHAVLIPAQSMKVYNLCCEHDHRFEGWFSSAEDFTSQSEQSRIACPVCDSHAVRRLPSAPRLNLWQEPQVDDSVKIQAQIMQMMRQVIVNTEDVGERFAEEARRIHYDEIPKRAIRGITTIAECEALVEEGIDVAPLPISAGLKQPLQ